ncbi:MAG TPA: aldehyde dehydrogenase family protein, partial [Dehalococcoidia bacterium]|nr:aldehyde dehydrogenase family protein [Dehalococcoidia bacterium]
QGHYDLVTIVEAPSEEAMMNGLFSVAEAGNVSIWKPASTAILSGYYLMRIFEEAGLPPGVIRPQLCGIALLPLVLMGCSALGSRRHPFAWMPILFVLWANLHGSFAIGLLVMGICTLAVIWDSIAQHRSFKRVLRDPHVNAFGLATIACTIATCFNPLGPRILVVVASFAGHPALQNITEWQPLVLKSLGGLLFFSSMIITAVVLRLSPRQRLLHPQTKLPQLMPRHFSTRQT